MGNEKNTDEEADTVGCCSLRVEHVKMETAPENHLHLNFLGKDSITYDNTTEILPEVYQLIKQFMQSKKPEQAPCAQSTHSRPTTLAFRIFTCALTLD